jgi:hypothetical protein
LSEPLASASGRLAGSPDPRRIAKGPIVEKERRRAMTSRRFHFVAGAALAAVLLATAAPARAEEKVLRDDWAAVYMMGAKLGWNHERTVEKILDGRTVIVSSTRMETKMERMGEVEESTEDSEVVEDKDGKLISFRSVAKESAMETELKGTVEAGKIRLERKLAGKQQPGSEVALDPEALAPWALVRFMMGKGQKPGTAWQVKAFSEDTPDTPMAISAKVAGPEEVDLLGTKRTLVRIDQTMVMKGMKILAKTWVDGEWTQWKMTVAMASLEMVRLPRELAVREGEVRDIFLQLLIPPDRKIPDARKLRTLAFRLELPEGEAFENFPSGDGQEILKQGPGFLELRIKAADPASALPRPVQASGMKLFLANTPYLQKDDPAVREIAEKAAGTELDSLKAAKALERWVFENIKAKNMGVGFATAAEVAKNLEGDCSEHGVLLAALCRAAGIPSRVVGGLIYAEELEAKGAEGRGAFGFHMWTEVFVGEWVALDATLGEGFADATHIALTRSALESESSQYDLIPLGKYMGKLTIKVME